MSVFFISFVCNDVIETYLLKKKVKQVYLCALVEQTESLDEQDKATHVLERYIQEQCVVIACQSMERDWCTVINIGNQTLSKVVKYSLICRNYFKLVIFHNIWRNHTKVIWKLRCIDYNIDVRTARWSRGYFFAA